MSDDSAQDGGRRPESDKWSLGLNVSRTPDNLVRLTIFSTDGWRGIDLHPDLARWIAEELVSVASRCEGTTP